VTASRLSEVIAARLPQHGVSVWWLGQAGFVLRGTSATVAIDPFLTDYGSFGRLYDPPLEPEELDTVDLLLATHDHADHIDPLGFRRILAASPNATAVVPAAVREHVVELVGSGERVLGASVDAALERCGVAVTPFPAVHGAQPADGYGFHCTERGEYPFLGYSIELDGVRIAHTGDTLVYDGLAERLRALDLDLLIVPINGTSWFREQRGIVGNMNVIEAAELAEASAARLVVPVHWDLFADNTEDPQHFMQRLATHHLGVNATVPSLGTRIDVVPADG
jgi:L-ascorbate 6-phosphate lactonase